MLRNFRRKSGTPPSPEPTTEPHFFVVNENFSNPRLVPQDPSNRSQSASTIGGNNSIVHVSHVSELSDATTSDEDEYGINEKRFLITGEVVQSLFDGAFSYSRLELDKLVDENVLTCRLPNKKYGFGTMKILGISDNGNQNDLIQQLKHALKTVVEEIDALKEKCIQMELNYRNATNEAAEELKRSINILFVLQQKSAKLEYSEGNEKKLRNEILRLRNRLANKEKERMLIEKEVLENEKIISMHYNELIELRTKLGGSAEELSQKFADAKLTAQVQANLNTALDKVKTAEADVAKKRDEITKLHTEVTSLSVALAQSNEERMRQVREVEDALRNDLQQVRDKVRDLEESKLLLTEELTIKKAEVKSCQRDLFDMQQVLTSLQERLAKVISDTKQGEGLVSSSDLLFERDLRIQVQQKLEKERAARVDVQNELAAAEREWDKVSEQVKLKSDKALRQIRELETERIVLMENAASKESKISQLKSEIDSLRTAVSMNEDTLIANVQKRLDVEHQQRLRELSQLGERRVQEMQSKQKEMEMKLMDANTQIRTMHNLIQELRGNIRVFARIRPLLSDGPDADTSSASSSSCLLPQIDGTSLKIIRTKVDSEGREPAEHKFNFDKIFGPESTQSEVFAEVSEFVQSALDGHRVCLFSYGQTGSGKTHTMQGYGAGKERGIIPRAIEQVGLYMDKIAEFGWEYTMEISFVEIYNETVRDLLRSNDDDNLKHDLIKDSDGNMVVKDVTMIEVDPHDSGQISSIMAQAARMRNVGATAMNSQSSRSHAIFCLHLHGINNIAGQALEGSLSLVDLAGSERLDRSNVTGDRLKETQAINKSLSCLADVFLAIANKQNHIPFRNSKLTYLLQPALSGTGKTLMMVNLSPTEESYLESLCSLRFANQVSQCVLGPAQKNIRSMASEKNAPKREASFRIAATRSRGSSVDVTLPRSMSMVAIPTHKDSSKK